MFDSDDIDTPDIVGDLGRDAMGVGWGVVRYVLRDLCLFANLPPTEGTF